MHFYIELCYVCNGRYFLTGHDLLRVVKQWLDFVFSQIFSMRSSDIPECQIIFTSLCVLYHLQHCRKPTVLHTFATMGNLPEISGLHKYRSFQSRNENEM